MKKLNFKTGFLGVSLTIILLALVISSCKNEGLTTGENLVSNFTDERIPIVPSNLEVPAGHHLIYHVYARGVQKYRCTLQNNIYVWTFVGPVADLFANPEFNGLVGTHYAGPHWESNSGSIVRGAVDQSAPSPDPNAIPWLLLHAITSTGPGIFNGVTYIQRVNTTGGRAPLTGCDAGSVGTEISVPYTAEYFFYKAQN